MGNVMHFSVTLIHVITEHKTAAHEYPRQIVGSLGRSGRWREDADPRPGATFFDDQVSSRGRYLCVPIYHVLQYNGSFKPRDWHIAPAILFVYLGYETN